MRLRQLQLPSSAASSLCAAPSHSWRPGPFRFIRTFTSPPSLLHSLSLCSRSFCSNSTSRPFSEFSVAAPEETSKRAPLKPGLYLVGTPIGNLEDITLRALRVLRSANVILSEDTRHSGKLLQHYDIKTPLLSYHKFNERQREQTVLKRLKQGEIVVVISDAGTPGISDPGMELAKSCVEENIPVIPIPGPSALVAALSASGLSTEEFTFVGFLPKHSGARRERLLISANEAKTQIFYVPPHKLHQFLEEGSPIFSESRRCVIAREITKIHEEFWRGSLGEAKEAFLTRQAKGEITLLIEGKTDSSVEMPSEDQLENELRHLMSSGHSLSAMIMDLMARTYHCSTMQMPVKREEQSALKHAAVKVVAEGTSTSRKAVYSLALRKFGQQREGGDD